jgi:hypothetical protein
MPLAALGKPAIRSRLREMASEQAGAASALTGLEALLGLVDDENAAFAAHQAVIAMAGAQ